jgi:hypothetical protein
MGHRGAKGRAGRFWLLGWEAAASHRARAPPTLATLMGALGSVGEDLRRHGTCVPVAMAGSAACPTTMGNGRTTGERATQVTGT